MKVRGGRQRAIGFRGQWEGWPGDGPCLQPLGGHPPRGLAVRHLERAQGERWLFGHRWHGLSDDPDPEPLGTRRGRLLKAL